VASNFKNWVNSTVAMSAAPIGRPGWPDLLLHRLHTGVELALGAALRLGAELGLELAALRGEAALEFVGVALDGLARDALGERKAVVALRAGDALRAVRR